MFPSFTSTFGIFRSAVSQVACGTTSDNDSVMLLLLIMQYLHASLGAAFSMKKFLSHMPKKLFHCVQKKET